MQEQLNKVAIKRGLDDILAAISWWYLRAATTIVDSGGRLISRVNYQEISATDISSGLIETGCKQSSSGILWHLPTRSSHARARGPTLPHDCGVYERVQYTCQ